MAGDIVKNIGDGDFSKEVLESDKPVLVDFWATWCAPCRAIAPTVEALAKELDGKVKFTKVNVDDNQQTAQDYGIRSIPTLLVFKGGKVVGQLVGAAPRDRIKDAIDKAFA
ncbi:thioredoxin [Hyalangium versicolor]|uniref:thioredoxin n=1 Tax=Hyalangium versicolor TaxID=2861190 RepID=UPI001CC9A47B|nr:thioredoxin [Hyalangium versicolor]